MSLQSSLEAILANYLDAKLGQFAGPHLIATQMSEIVEVFRQVESVRSRPTIKVVASFGKGNWANIPWIAFLDSRETNSTQSGVYPVILFRQDMTGLYVTFNQGVTSLREKFKGKDFLPELRRSVQTLRKYVIEAEQHGFQLDNGIDLKATTQLGKDYQQSRVAYKLYEAGSVPPDTQILQDLEQMLRAYDRYLADKYESPPPVEPSSSGSNGGKGAEVDPSEPFMLEVAAERLLAYIAAQGFTFEPWQVAQYLTAVRTKPFVILAGISGTGKSKLPALVAAGTGGTSALVPVRPDWTDSSDTLGYTDLQGSFRPGAVLEVARNAMLDADQHWTCIIDEMNIARVEQYFAEVLSKIEDRRQGELGGYESAPLLLQALSEADAHWASVVLPSNLTLVGTVNMDESTHGFSRKVLDRAFTIELSDADLDDWQDVNTLQSLVEPEIWPLAAWVPRAIMLSRLENLRVSEVELITDGIKALREVNAILAPAQFQVGYRTRDEVALFLLHAEDLRNLFVDRNGEPVTPLDLALQMKILPRIIGGSSAVRKAVLGLLGWSVTGNPFVHESEAQEQLDLWDNAGRPRAIASASFPQLAARLTLMWERLLAEGYTSYWL